MNRQDLRDKITILKADTLFAGKSLNEVNDIPKDVLDRSEREIEAIMQLVDEYAVYERMREHRVLSKMIPKVFYGEKSENGLKAAFSKRFQELKKTVVKT